MYASQISENAIYINLTDTYDIIPSFFPLELFY